MAPVVVYRVHYQFRLHQQLQPYQQTLHVLAGDDVRSVTAFLEKELLGAQLPIPDAAPEQTDMRSPPAPPRALVVELSIFSVERMCALDLVDPEGLMRSGLFEVVSDGGGLRH